MRKQLGDANRCLSHTLLKCLGQKTEAPAEPRAFWVGFFSARGRMQREKCRKERTVSYDVARELQWGGEIALPGWRLPVFTEGVVIHALGLHVWVKVLFLFHCSQKEKEDISDFLKRRLPNKIASVPLTAGLFELSFNVSPTSCTYLLNATSVHAFERSDIWLAFEDVLSDSSHLKSYFG